MMNLNNNVKTEYCNLFFPLAIEQIFMMIIGNVNVFLLSLYTDNAVAATGLADQVMSIGTMAMGIVSLGSTIVFLQNADEKHIKYIQGAVRAAFVLNIILATILSATSFIFGHKIMALMQTPEELRDMSILYLKIVSLSFLFQGISTTISSIIRSFGHVKIAMKVSIINTILTIIGNALVILTPIKNIGGGVLGIAVSTVITRAIGSIISGYALRENNRGIWLNLKDFRKSDIDKVKKILSLGIPSGMENVSYNFSQTMIAGVVASLGAIAITSKIYSQTITAIVFTLSVAAGQASQIIIGKFLRNKEIDKAKRFGIKHVKYTVLFGMMINSIIALFGRLIIPIFTNNLEIINLTHKLLIFNIIYDPLRSANEVLIAGLNTVGYVKTPVFVGIITTYLFTVPGIILGVKYLKFGIIGVWTIFIIDEGLRALIFYLKWKKGVGESFGNFSKKANK